MKAFEIIAISLQTNIWERRNVDDEIIHALKLRAAHKRRSAEAAWKFTRALVPAST